MIKKTATGYQVIIRWREDGKIKHHTKAGFKLKREAEEYENRFRADKSGHVSSDTTFKDLIQDYFDLTSANYNKSTKMQKERLIKVFIEPLNKKRLTAINSKTILKVYNDIRLTDYSRKYKNDGIGMLKSLLHFANSHYNTRFDTMSLKRIPPSSDDVLLEHNTWTNDEFEQFIKHVDHQGTAALFTLLYRTGLRRGEALALSVSDVNQESKSISVTKSIGNGKKSPHALKTASSKRIVFLDEKAYNEIEPYLIQPDHYYLFGGVKPLRANTVQNRFVKAIELSGVKRIRIHDLRHSHATNLINNGANIVAVSRRLGHSTTDMTLRVYTHLLDKTEKDLLNFI